MYRHALYINCVGCGHCLSLQESELDEEGRDICVRCHSVRRVDLTLARWRQDRRNDRWLYRGAVALALALVAAVPALFIVTATIAGTLLVATATIAFTAWIARENQD